MALATGGVSFAFPGSTGYHAGASGARMFPLGDDTLRTRFKLLSMVDMTRFTYGDEVRVIKGEYEGTTGAVVGMNDPDTPSVFTIEFGNGSDAEVPLESLEKIASS